MKGGYNMVLYTDIITGTEWTVNEKRNGRKELIANEGFWITDKTINENSSFSKKVNTKTPERYGTITDAEKIYIEEEIKKLTTL